MLTLFNWAEFEKVIKYLPGYAIFLGAVKLIIFYNAFNIRIVSYLELSEVLISFLDTMIFVAVVLLVPLIIILSFWGKPIGAVNTEVYNASLELNFWQRLGRKLKLNITQILSSLIPICLLVFTGEWNELKSALILLYIVSPVVYFTAIEIRIAFKKQYTYTIPATYMNLFFLMYMTGQVVIYYTLLDVNSIKYRYKYIGSQFEYEHNTIKSDSVNAFVGQTKSFIFFYNLSSKQSTVYTKDKLVSISIKGE